MAQSNDSLLRMGRITTGGKPTSNTDIKYKLKESITLEDIQLNTASTFDDVVAEAMRISEREHIQLDLISNTSKRILISIIMMSRWC